MLRGGQYSVQVGGTVSPGGGGGGGKLHVYARVYCPWGTIYPRLYCPGGQYILRLPVHPVDRYRNYIIQRGAMCFYMYIRPIEWHLKSASLHTANTQQLTINGGHMWHLFLNPYSVNACACTPNDIPYQGMMS